MLGADHLEVNMAQVHGLGSRASSIKPTLEKDTLHAYLEKAQRRNRKTIKEIQAGASIFSVQKQGAKSDDESSSVSDDPAWENAYLQHARDARYERSQKKVAKDGWAQAGRKGMERVMHHAEKAIAYRRGLNVERRVSPSDGDIENSFDEHGRRVKDYGGQNVKSFVARAAAEKYYINKLEYSKLPKQRAVQMTMDPIEYESPEVLARREKALVAKLKQFSFIEDEIKRQMHERKAALLKGDVAIDDGSTPQSHATKQSVLDATISTD